MEREKRSIDQSLVDLTMMLHGRQDSWMQKTARLEHILFNLERPYHKLHSDEQDLVDGMLAYVTDKKGLSPEMRSRATVALTNYTQRQYVIAFPSPQKALVPDNRGAYLQATPALTTPSTPPRPHGRRVMYPIGAIVGIAATALWYGSSFFSNAPHAVHVQATQIDAVRIALQYAVEEVSIGTLEDRFRLVDLGTEMQPSIKNPDVIGDSFLRRLRHPRTHQPAPHPATDIMVPYSTGVYPPIEGTYCFSRSRSGHGNLATASNGNVSWLGSHLYKPTDQWHDLPRPEALDHLFTKWFLQGSRKQASNTDCRIVTYDDFSSPLFYVGTTGNATGPHLHEEMGINEDIFTTLPPLVQDALRSNQFSRYDPEGQWTTYDGGTMDYVQHHIRVNPKMLYYLTGSEEPTPAVQHLVKTLTEDNPDTITSNVYSEGYKF